MPKPRKIATKRPPRPGGSPLPILAAILFLTAFLRLFQLTTIPPPLNFDEAMNGNEAMENIELGRIAPFYPQNSGREGLYINLETALIYFFGPQAWLLRLPAALFGILTVWGVYLLTCELFRARIALAASFFTAASFWHLLFSRLGLRAIGAPLFAVWSLYFLLAAIRGAREMRPYLGRAAAAGVLCGLGFYTYIAYRVTPALFLAAMIYGFLELRRTKAVPAAIRLEALFSAACLATVLPLAIYFLHNPDGLVHRTSEISIFKDASPASEFAVNVWKTVQMIFTRGDSDWRDNIAFRPAVFWPVAILFALGAALSLRAVFRDVDRRFPHALLLGWIVLGALPALFSNENMPSQIRSILMIPPIFILAAWGASELYRWLEPRAPRRVLKAAAAILLAGVLYDAYHSYFERWAKNPDVAANFDAASVDIANRVLALPPGAPKYVVTVTPGTTGMPIPSQTVMFLTQSYTEKQRRETNIHYIFRERDSDPDGVDFCRQAGVQYRENIFCLVANRKAAPKF